MLPLEVTPLHIARYVAWLGLRGSVAADSLQPYLSAINRFLQDHGKAQMALAPLVLDIRAGLKNSHVVLNPLPARIPLPGPVALDILVAAEQLGCQISWSTPTLSELLQLRNALAVLVNYTFFCRGD